MSRLLRLTLALTLLVATACASDVVMVAAKPPAHYEKLGRTMGEACGVLLFYSTVYSIIPIQLTSRIDRAYAEAVTRQPGTTGLINAELSGSWFWWVLGTTYCTHLEADAIREVAAPPEPPPAAPVPSEPAPAPEKTP